MDKQEFLRASAPAEVVHVGLNAHLLSTAQNYRAAGISVYIRNLLRHLPLVDGGYRFTAFLSARNRAPLEGIRTRATRWPTHTPALRILWEQVAQPLALVREGVDLFHALAFVAPVACPCPFVVTVYDLSFVRFPAAFRPWNRLYLTLFTRHSVRRARRVLAISHHTKRDLVRWLGMPEDKVDVAPCGVGEAFRPLPREQVEAFREAKGLPSQFLLFVGTLEPRKNLPAALQALRRLLDAGQAPYLVVVGGRGWGYAEALRSVDELGLTHHVRLVGFVPLDELVLWYNAATALVYPSLYEGFGLPPLEAMACGLPVVASDRGALPEVVGEAGLLVDLAIPEQLAEVLTRVWQDADLRTLLRERGLARAREASWRETARQTLLAYDKALGQRRT
ncbi:MAG: glycosyltransferase family 4 protein [Anaerolineae bacterium]